MDTLNTPDQFFRLVVEQNLRDYWEHRDDMRCAFNAAVTCLSMRDWMLANSTSRIALDKRRRRYTQWITRREPALQEIFDIANCSKHFRLDFGPSKGRTSESIGWEYFRCGDPVGVSLRPLRVETRNGQIVRFQDLLIAAVAYWRQTNRRGVPRSRCTPATSVTATAQAERTENN